MRPWLPLCAYRRPILLLYFTALFMLTMKRQIKHMWKHKYVPWSSGKKKYKTKEPVDTVASGGGPPAASGKAK